MARGQQGWTVRTCFRNECPKEGDIDYNTGYLMAYHEVISTMKNQASLFDLGQKDISLADIEPDRDLV